MPIALTSLKKKFEVLKKLHILFLILCIHCEATIRKCEFIYRNRNRELQMLPVVIFFEYPISFKK